MQWSQELVRKDQFTNWWANTSFKLFFGSSFKPRFWGILDYKAFLFPLKEKKDGDLVPVLAVNNSVLSMLSSSSSVQCAASRDLSGSISRHWPSGQRQVRVANARRMRVDVWVAQLCTSPGHTRAVLSTQHKRPLLFASEWRNVINMTNLLSSQFNSKSVTKEDRNLWSSSIKTHGLLSSRQRLYPSLKIKLHWRWMMTACHQKGKTVLFSVLWHSAGLG